MSERDSSAQPNDMENLIYLYCVTNKMPDVQEGRDLADNLYLIYHQGLYAVMSIVSSDEFSEDNLKKNMADLEWIKAKAGLHEKIIEEIMEDVCVVPFKLATLFTTVDSLRMCLEEHLEEFKDNLKRLKGREEWGVKIYCDVERLKDSIVREDEEILEINKEINSASPGKAFFLSKKKEELLDAVANKILNEYSKTSFDRLIEHGRQARINKLLPKEVTERKDEMIFNSSFLVDKGKVGEFVRAVDYLNGEYTGMGINLDCTGPWPPYNFIV